jgi:hypothetical protein
MIAFARLAASAALIALLGGSASIGQAQTDPARTPTLLEEIKLSAYVENSGIVNLAGSDVGEVNELRFYDSESDYSFNMAEVSVKKDLSDARPFGFGLVVTGGRDAQKNHALGLFREEEDIFPFEDTPEVDLQEVYASYRVPIGSGLTLKAGKFVTLLGYEVIESPLNLNASRSLLFVYSIPLTHVGGLLSYPLGSRVTLTGGPVVGWDVLDDNNGQPSWMGQLAVTPTGGLVTNFQVVAGPEQFDTDKVRWVGDLVVSYSGIEKLTLGLNGDYGWEDDEASLVAAGLPETDASWGGVAGYAAYDWTARLRTAGRVEYFDDTDGVRTLALGAGQGVKLWEVTATVQLNVWNGLFGRVEYRHDQADADIFDIQGAGGAPTSDTQDTVGFTLYYMF